MAYSRIEHSHIQDSTLRKVFNHTDLMLSDLYSNFLYDAPAETNGGRGNFTIALVLACIIDGIASEVWPTRPVVCEQDQRFKKLVRERMPWESDRRPWVQRGTAANVLYLEVRNALVHEIGKDKATRARPAGWDEPAVNKWRKGARMSADELDASESWPLDWPVMTIGHNDVGVPRYELSAAALYWAVQRMVKAFSADTELLNDAIRLR